MPADTFLHERGAGGAVVTHTTITRRVFECDYCINITIMFTGQHIAGRHITPDQLDADMHLCWCTMSTFWPTIFERAITAHRYSRLGADIFTISVERPVRAGRATLAPNLRLCLTRALVRCGNRNRFAAAALFPPTISTRVGGQIIAKSYYHSAAT